MRPRILPLLLLFTICTVSAIAQPKDTVLAIQSPGLSQYQYCFDLTVRNRHASPITVSEFRLRIVSGRARLIGGQSESPTDWAIFQQQSSVVWTATTSAAEITAGNSLSGFRVCANDTGVVRLVWETRNIDSLLSSDTLVFVGVGRNCDEVFPTVIPSSVQSVFQLDVANANISGAPINTLRLRMLTPGISFDQLLHPIPSGWLRTISKTDTLQFSTVSKPINAGTFMEGFYFGVLAAKGDTFDIEYVTGNFGVNICYDTLKLRYNGLLVDDSLRLTNTGSADSCCYSMRLRNQHNPQSSLEYFTFKLQTPGAKFSRIPTPPNGWSLVFGPAGGDSIAYRRTTGLAQADSAVFASMCIDNVASTTDTVHYQWRTFNRGLLVTSQTNQLVCVRPMITCDRMTITRDTAVGPNNSQCISLKLVNSNSRKDFDERLVIRIANPGVARTFASITPAPGWYVYAAGGDSVVLLGLLLPGDSTTFGICLGTQSAHSYEPLTLSWGTSNPQRSVCAGSVNLVIVPRSDTLTATAAPSDCCFAMKMRNANDEGAVIDSMIWSFPQPQITFRNTIAPAGWKMAISSNRSSVTFRDNQIPVDSVLTGLSTCAITRSGLPVAGNFTMEYRTYSKGQLLTTDSVVLFCAAVELCDTLELLSAADAGDACGYRFQLHNVHTPSSNLDRMIFQVDTTKAHIVSGFVGDGASAWTVTGAGDAVEFNSTTPMSSGAVLATFGAVIKPNAGITTIAMDFTTYNGSTPACTGTLSLPCTAASVSPDVDVLGVKSISLIPNPSHGSATLSYQLTSSQVVECSVYDVSMRQVVVPMTATNQYAGLHSVPLDLHALASGIYYVRLMYGAREVTTRLVVVR